MPADRPVIFRGSNDPHGGLLSVPCTGAGRNRRGRDGPNRACSGGDPKYKVTELFCSDVIYALLDIPDLGQVDFSSMKYFMYGAAQCRGEAQAGDPGHRSVMMGGYGQTEAPASIAYLPRASTSRAGRSLRMSACRPWAPEPAHPVEIMDDANEILPRGQTGEICVRATWS